MTSSGDYPVGDENLSPAPGITGDLGGGVLFDILSRNFFNLTVFRTAIAHGSVNKAAAALRLTQPAVTRAIARLEEAVSAKLIERSARGVTATIFGNAIIGHVTAAVDELDKAQRKLKLLQRASAGAVACGAAPVSMNTLVTEAAFHFQKRYPGDGLRLVEAPTPDLLAMMQTGELDIVIGSQIAHGEPDGLIAEPLIDEVLGIYARAGHGLDTEQPAAVSDLLTGHSWVFPDRGSHLYDFVHSELDRRGVAPPIHLIQTRSVSAFRWFLTKTDYLSFSTSLIVLPDLRAGEVVRVKTDWPFPTTKHVLYRRHRSRMSRAGLAFCDAIKRVASYWAE